MSAPYEPKELALLLDRFRAALDEEVEAIRDDLARRGIDQPLAATGGREIDTEAIGFAYDWLLPPGKYLIRPDDAVRIACDQGDTLGFVGSFDSSARALRVLVPEWLGRSPGPATMQFDPTWLIGALASRLRSVEDDPGSYHVRTALRAFGREYPETGRREPEAWQAEGLNFSQTEALSRILGSRVQLVWGPPGTGKTRLLSRAARALAPEGAVLVLATTNVAVDEAARRIADSMGPEAVRDGRVVRVGAEFSSTGDTGLSLGSVVELREARSPSRLTRLLEELEGELLAGRPGREPRPLRSRFGQLLNAGRSHGSPGVMTRLGHVALEFQRAETRALSEADVVLSTFARMTLRDDLWRMRFRSVLIDEASAAPLPYVFAGACLASDRAVAVGDFQQLPAVVMSRGEEAGRWLSRNIFREAGVIDPGNGRDLPDPADALCSMLREQYRMAPPIRALISDLFYGGRLVDSDCIGARDGSMRPLVLADTESLSPRVDRAEGSRANDVHLEVVLQLLELLGRRGISDVGIVTPYRLQSRRIAHGVRTRLGRAAPGDLEIATIHRFQGREKSAVILDTVDAPPGGSWFLSEDRNPEFPLLLNVAMSRSRDSLIVVGTEGGLRRTLPSDALLIRVIQRIRESGSVLDCSALARAAGKLFTD